MRYKSLKIEFFKITLFFFFFYHFFIYSQEFYSGSTSVFVSYANAKANPQLDKSPKVNVSFDNNHRHIPLVMDTGSVGIIVSADHFTPDPHAKNLGPGKQIYSSSGIIEEGTWWTSTQKIYDAEGHLLAITEVPVLRVDSIKCSDNARACHPHKHPKGVAMMGIGFARESKQQSRGTPNYNPFLNIKTILQQGELKPLPKDWHSGYVVTATGVHLGLTPTNTANGGFIKLEPWPEYSTANLKEWRPVPMTINVNGIKGDGHILMDTGVGTAYLTPPASSEIGKLVVCPKTSHRECAPEGTTVSVYLPNQDHPIVHYTYTAGGKNNSMQPVGTHVVAKKDSKIFLNTSRHVLQGIDFFYDNDNGYMGYIWNGKSSHSVGFVKPTAPRNKFKPE